MTVKEHYDNHLGYFYSWMMGDFDKNVEEFGQFCTDNGIIPKSSKIAIDLGAGNGIQSIALSKLGFDVKAIDFSSQLLDELESKTGNNPIVVINEDIRHVRNHNMPNPELIVCCGDTLTHLESIDEIRTLIYDCFNILSSEGKILLSFRDYTNELHGASRFIQVKSDSDKILTCFLEYFPKKIRCTDLFFELSDGKWIQKVSSYYKTRVSKHQVIEILKKIGFTIILDTEKNEMINILAEKITNSKNFISEQIRNKIDTMTFNND
jgi:hypothetical protein